VENESGKNPIKIPSYPHFPPAIPSPTRDLVRMKKERKQKRSVTEKELGKISPKGRKVQFSFPQLSTNIHVGKGKRVEKSTSSDFMPVGRLNRKSRKIGFEKILKSHCIFI